MDQQQVRHPRRRGRTEAMPSNHARTNGKNKNRNHSNRRGDGHDGDGGQNDDDMDDIIAQLRKQRQRSKEAAAAAASESELKVANTNVKIDDGRGLESNNAYDKATIIPSASRLSESGSSSTVVDGPHQKNNQNRMGHKIKKINSSGNAAAKSVGNFIYDPVRKRYFPASTFTKPNGNNDVCIQRMQDASSIVRKENNKVGHFSRPLGAVTDEEIKKLVFRGITLQQLLQHPFAGDSDNESLACDGSKKRKKRKKKFNTNTSIGLEQINEDEAQNFINDNKQNIDHIRFPYSETPFSNSEVDKPIPCSERSTLLLVSSLQYCTNSLRRATIVSTLGPMRIARGAKVVPTVATKDMLEMGLDFSKSSYLVCSRRKTSCHYDDAVKMHAGDEKKISKQQQHKEQTPKLAKSSTRSSANHIWFSMLHPIIPSRQLQTKKEHTLWNQNNGIPYDCQCKSYLHSTAPTFDIYPTSSTDLPHAVTIANSSIHYRQKLHVPLCGRQAFKLGVPGFGQVDSMDKGTKVVELLSSMTEEYQGVRFASYSGQEDVLVASASYDPSREQAYFSLQNTRRTSVQKAALNAPVNDFCFDPNATLEDPGIVAFAHGGDTQVGTSFFDILSGSVCGVYENFLDSDPLCVKFRRNNGKHQIFYGHRDGTVSMCDTRTRVFDVASFSRSGDSFGSASALLPLQDDNLLLVKGSFGSCRVLDMRRLPNNEASSSKTCRSTLMRLSVPSSQVHNTKSAKCAGLAMDPTESIVIAPFASQSNDVMLAMWCIRSGILVRTINVREYVGVNQDFTGASVFCELSSAVTPGFEMQCKYNSDTPIIYNRKESYGLWFKSGSVTDSSPIEGGSIHHILLS